MQNQISTIQGKLVLAVKGGGDSALWGMAKGKGVLAEKAREVIELTTSPFVDVSIYQAIEMVCREKK